MELNFSKLEQEILEFWKKNKIFEKSISRRKGAPDFKFYEGPPTANAKPGLHHVLSRVYKDIICRYKTMRGFQVLRKAGWDTHGLPVELEAEKKLGLKSKKEIEKYGIAKFNEECKKSVWQYQRDWEKLTERIGFWLDMEHPYITYQSDYIETVWWILKQIYQKGLMYQDYKVVPYCPRCQTGLSSHEVALGYKKIKEPAIYVRFKIKDLRFKNTYLLVWTTTPWTLPGNVAIAANENFVYCKVKIQIFHPPQILQSKTWADKNLKTEYLILAKERLNVLGTDYEIIEEFKGKDLLGLEYESLFRTKLNGKKAYYMIAGDFVAAEEGTGLVHIAPAFGEEDMKAIKTRNSNLKSQNLPEIPILLTVNEEGRFKAEVKQWAGMFVKDADSLIIKNLKERSLLFKEELYEHDYPFCWRCLSPLLYYAKESWFINMQKVKKNLIKNNRGINWIPAHLKEGRFGEWLREVKDWAFSRERYWGTPLPIWQCQIGKSEIRNSKSQTNPKSQIPNSKHCNNVIVIGSLKDLLKQKFSTNQYYILRHGQNIYQTQKKEMMYPPFEEDAVLLTKEGEKQIEEAASALWDKKIDLIYASDFPRTRQTAEIVAKRLGVHPVKSSKAGALPKAKQFNRVKVIFDKKLRDVNLGVYHGGKKEDFYRKFPRRADRFYNGKPAKGESWGRCRKRMVDCLCKIDRKHRNKTILIVSHGDPLWLLEGAMKGWSDQKLVDKKIKGDFIRTGEVRKIEFKKIPLDGEGRWDFHRPHIDGVEFYCPECGAKMRRAPEVIDCWFDAGSMPLAQAHFPFACAQSQISKLNPQNYQNLIKKIQFPADYISEAVDQTRGWFYTLLAISTLLDFGTPYKNVISLGHVLDEKGEKMSKSKANVVDPWQITEKYGADATRWYFYTVNRPGDSKLFSEKDISGTLKKFILTFWNSYQFFQTYISQIPRSQKSRRSRNILDRWIVSRLNELTQEATEKLDKYDVTGAARAIENFVVNDLSLWYIRRSRKRFAEAAGTLALTLETLAKLTAPFVPFLSEEIHRNLVGVKSQQTQRSVHLEDWPKANGKLINKKLNQKMEKVREMVRLALTERAKAGIRVRQPLLKLEIKEKMDRDMLKLIKEEINVKEIVFGKRFKLDIRITPELKEEGMIREVIRHIQEMRKMAGLKPKDRILVGVQGSANLANILIKNKKFILKEAGLKDLKREIKEKFDLEKETKVDDQKLRLVIKKL